MQLTFTHQNYRAYRSSELLCASGNRVGGMRSLLEQAIEDDINVDDGRVLNRFYGQYARGSLEEGVCSYWKVIGVGLSRAIGELEHWGTQVC